MVLASILSLILSGQLVRNDRDNTMLGHIRSIVKTYLTIYSNDKHMFQELKQVSIVPWPEEFMMWYNSMERKDFLSSAKKKSRCDLCSKQL